MRALGVFIFAGGFTEGVKRHFDVAGHLEGSSYGVATSKLNHPGLQVWESQDQWPETFSGGVDFVYANPPCAVWSLAGSRGRDFSLGYDPRDVRINCFLGVFSRLRAYRPAVLAVESVCQAATRGEPVIRGLAAEAATMGYSLTEVFHNAYDCGVPQDRRRCFFVFHRVCVPFAPANVPGPRTVREAWADLPPDPSPESTPISTKWVELVERCPEGGKLRAVHRELYGESTWDAAKKKHMGRPGFLHRRLAWDRASPTHTGGATLIHPSENRRITVREAQVLCGYPASYQFVGKNLNDRFAQVAQAVTPPAGAWIAGLAAEAIRMGVPFQGAPQHTRLNYLKKIEVT